MLFFLYICRSCLGAYRPIHKKFWVLWDFGDWIALSFVLFSCSLGFLNSKKFIWEGCEPVTPPPVNTPVVLSRLLQMRYRSISFN